MFKKSAKQVSILSIDLARSAADPDHRIGLQLDKLSQVSRSFRSIPDLLSDTEVYLLVDRGDLLQGGQDRVVPRIQGV
jgi:hypothetical protein